MRILILNTTERTGGAAIAATRLAKALQDEGVEVKMLTRRNNCQFSILNFQFSIKALAFYWERLRIFWANRLSKRGLWQVDIANCGEDVTRTQAFKEADVVHLHWVNQGFISLKTLEKILHSGKRILWTLHDQWPYTGICHYAESCDRYQTHCHDCPQLHRPVASPARQRIVNCQLSIVNFKDLAAQVFETKRRIYADADLTFVGCSQWIAEEARRSPLTEGHRIVSIPNAIDPRVFHPMPQEEARRQFGLPLEKKIVLFICQKVTDERKGMRYLDEALVMLPDVQVVRIGKGGDFEIHDERRMAQIYAAADVFVTPSLQDNLPNTIVEAMSCGTPCVGFRVGGIPEMIHHLQNGYVARYRDADDLAKGIRYVLSHPALREAAAQTASATYNPRRVAQCYIDLMKNEQNPNS